jgi:2-keto-3-deoxy-L-rhamnonate aldolase RhmA
MAPFIPSLASTGPQLGIFVGFSDPLATSLVAAAGYDFVIVRTPKNTYPSFAFYDICLG